MRNIGELLSRLSGIKKLSTGGYTALCPGHTDKRASLSVIQEGDKILIKCFSGCETEAVMKSLGLELKDLFINEEKLTEKKVTPLGVKTASIVKTYDYLDESGKMLYQTVRYEPKDFRQRKPDGKGDWIWSLNGCRKVLYRLPEILKQETVYLVEGEKDADNLWLKGLPATTSPCGASAWQPSYSDFLKGKQVIIIPDRDAPGYNYARDAANSLDGKAKSLQVIFLPEAKDISDWLESGNDFTKLPAMWQDISALFADDEVIYKKEDEAILWHKKLEGFNLTFRAEKMSDERTGIHARISILVNQKPATWSYFNIERSEDRTRLSNLAASQIKSETYNKDDMRRDLDSFCSGLWEFNLKMYQPELLDGDSNVKPINFLLRPYLLEGGGTILFAPPGRGKSNSALLWAVSIDAGVNTFWPIKQEPVLFINLERSRASLKRRLSLVNTVLGLEPNRPLLMLNARGKSLSDVAATCRRTIKECGVGLVILDSISRAGYGDLNENRSVNSIIDALSSLCDSWLALAHTPRADESHIFGGIHFDAGADIVVQLSSEIKDDGTLGVGYQVTKSNDLPNYGLQTYAMEFNELGLSAFRKAKDFEFPDIAGKSRKPTTQEIMDFILEQDSAESTATEIAESTGFNLKSVSRYLNKSGSFIRTRKIGKNQFYAVKEKRSQENTTLYDKDSA